MMSPALASPGAGNAESPRSGNHGPDAICSLAQCHCRGAVAPPRCPLPFGRLSPQPQPAEP